MAGGAAERAYDYLYEQILSGRLTLGAPVSEVEISEALKISRSPVREALKRMEAQGLITHYASRGAFVTDITLRDLEEIFDLRILMELFALETACRRIDDATLDRLEAMLLSLNKTSSPQEFFEANSKLHDTIVSYGGNRRLEGLLDMLSAQIAIVNRISARAPGHFDDSTHSHLELVRIIRTRDIAAAKECLKNHLIEVRTKTLEEYSIHKDRRI